ncbi:MAG: hypothetical protein U0R72_20830 [Nakamurella multipartita]
MEVLRRNARRAATGTDTRGAARPRTRPATDRLRQQRGAGGQRQEGDHEDLEDQPGRLRAVLQQQTGQQRADAEPAGGGDAVDQGAEPRAVGGLQIKQVGPEHADRRAGGQPLDDPGDDQRAHAVRAEEDGHRRGLHDQGDGQDGTPTDVVREPADGEQAQQQGEHVDGEDRGQGGRGESERGLVDRIERARCAGGGQQSGDGRGHHPEARSPRQGGDRAGKAGALPHSL